MRGIKMPMNRALRPVRIRKLKNILAQLDSARKAQEGAIKNLAQLCKEAEQGLRIDRLR